MKEDELRRLSKCAACGRKIGQTQIPILWKVTLERHFLDLAAIQRQNGLAMMLGGNGVLASVMGANEDMTKPIMDKLTVMICDDCSCKDVVLAQIAEDSGNDGTHRPGSPDGSLATETRKPGSLKRPC